jgi:hypothetical protein
MGETIKLGGYMLAKISQVSKNFKVVKIGFLGAVLMLSLSATKASASERSWGHNNNWRDHDRHDRYGRSHDRWDHHRGYGHWGHHYPSYGRVVFDLPWGAVSIRVGGSRYYFSEGVYYRRDISNYIVVPPPQGVIVTSLPVGLQPIIVNGTTYYTGSGIYYQYTPQGYVVVPQPSPVIQTVSVASPVNVTDSASGEDITINVSNAHGGYTAVTIKRSGEGFVGPQGEYYNEFPKVEQLRVMYGK